MDEFDALARLADELGVGDDCATLPTPDEQHLLVTTDMLHDETDFPDGATPYTVGWRAASVSLSDIAANGGRALGVVVAYGAPTFDGLDGVVDGVRDACATCGVEYVGGDLDGHGERTVVSTAVGAADAPVGRDGAREGDIVAVTGALGRTAVGLRAFDADETERANHLFRFTPRVAEGRALASHATAMTDLSDGVAVGLHNLAEPSGVGFDVERDALPLVDGAHDDDIFVGEDYELLVTLPPDAVEEARGAVGGAGLTVVGETVGGDDVHLDGEPLERRGYEH